MTSRGPFQPQAAVDDVIHVIQAALQKSEETLPFPSFGMHRHNSLEGQAIPIVTNRSERENLSNRGACGQTQPPSPSVLASVALALSASIVH